MRCPNCASSGLRPLSDAELTRARDDWQKGAWDRYGGYVVGGLLVVGGVALMATGVGGIAGAALIGATDVLTGSVAGAVGGRIGARTTALDEVTAARRASGLTEHPLFTQTTARPEFGHGPFESRTIGEVSARIRSGEIDPSALPVDVVRRDGQVLGMNTRSMLTLRRAGVPPSEWTVRDMSGAPRVERLLDDRLMRNQLGEGVETIRITGVGSKASSLR